MLANLEWDVDVDEVIPRFEDGEVGKDREEEAEGDEHGRWFTEV